MEKISILMALAVVGCGKGKSEPPPAKPATGAPMAFVATKVTPGDNHDGAVAVRAYNFSDKTIAQYAVLLRYHDAGGAVLKVKPGTPFEADFDHWSFSGLSFKCAPTSWCEFTLDHLDVPAGAAKADVVASRLTALKDDIHFEDKELFEMDQMSWPASMK